MGNPNPSPETRFKVGNAANPGGKTKDQKRKEIEAAEMALELRHKMLSGMLEKLEIDNDATKFIKMECLRLIKDSEDRAYGLPKAMLAGEDGQALPVSIKLEFE
ncbi:MAG: hypothetical protein U5K75_12175 [Ahrensia sp.]|nr:hypothetical protein [Ahrensia sp.]